MVLFTSYRGPPDYRVAVHSLQSGEQRTLIKPGSGARYLPTGHLIYAWEGNLLAAPFDLEELQVTGPSVRVVEGVRMAFGWANFSVSENGSLAYVPGRAGLDFQLVWVDHEGTVEPLPLLPGFFDGPRVSPDGRSFVYRVVHDAGTTNVWLYELERGVNRQFTTNPARGAGAWPIWGPEGKRVIFNSTRSDGMAWNLYWKPVDGSGPAEPLTESDYSQQAVSVWAKGKLLAFQEIRDPTATGYDIWILPLQGGAQPRPFLQTSANEFLPMFSPDGRWLAYVSDQTGKREIYVQPYPGPGEVKQISSEGGTHPAWAPDGQELFYMEGDHPSTKLMAVPVQTEPSLRVGRPRLLFSENYWSGSPLGRNYDITPHGERFLMRKEVTQPMTKIKVVLNWSEELKRLVPTDN